VLTPECELILVDDGSVPSLESVCETVTKPYAFTLHLTRDWRPWTQPKARNTGAELASASKLLFFDIDHILTQEIISLALTYAGDKLHWIRKPGVLDENGYVVTNRHVLMEHGMRHEGPSLHPNSFMIRRGLFQRLGGYNESFCGQYGGDDIDFNKRYDRLCSAGVAAPPHVQGFGYYYPDPAHDRKWFHSLRRDVALRQIGKAEN
jgi:hypothetical protein